MGGGTYGKECIWNIHTHVDCVTDQGVIEEIAPSVYENQNRISLGLYFNNSLCTHPTSHSVTK